MKVDPGTPFVVDTNVAIVANEAAEVDTCCIRTCIDALERIAKQGIVVVDDDQRIVNEYWNHLTPGKAGVGNAFFKHVHDHQFGGEKVRRVRITPSDDECGFEELPPNSFDRSDRKFLAAAVSGKADVVNATDSDWEEHAALTRSLEVRVHQLCPRYAVKSHDARKGLRA